MGNFDRRNGSRQGGRAGFGGRGRSFRDRNRSGRDRGERQMHKVVCSNCGKDCEVPFKPTSDKPVYCNDCFEKFGGRNNDKNSFNRLRGDRRSDGGSYSLKPQLEALNAKLDKIISLLTPQVTEEKPAEPEIVEEVVEGKTEVEVKAPKKKIASRKKTDSTSE